MKKGNGQNLVEFAIIIGLVVVVAVAALSLMGDNIHSMFGKSNDKYKTYKPFGSEVPSSNPADGPGEIEKQEPVPGSYVSSRGLPFTRNEDGSVDFTVNSQDVTLSSDILEDIGIVFDTVSTNGLEDHVIDTIAILINKYASEYEPDDVPIDVSSGNAYRSMNDAVPGKETIVGDSSLQQVTIVVGDPTNKEEVREAVVFINENAEQENDTDRRGVFRLNMPVGTGGTVSDETTSISTIEGSERLKDVVSAFSLGGSYDGSSQSWELSIINEGGTEKGTWNIGLDDTQ